MRKTIILTLVLLILAAIPCTALQETAPRKLTVMVYLCGSNLESSYGSASADLEEIAKAPLDYSQVSVLVMGGGSSAWASEFRSEETVIKELGRAPFAAASGFRPIQAGGERKNMGDSATLSQFLTACAERAPAEEYALIIWDHGGGPVNGVCWDELNGGDHLTLDELSQALADSPFRDRKLSWIGFDARLMSSVEVASKMAPYAEYMIASQAEEPVSGWNYAFLSGIEQDQNGAETGMRIVDSYFDFPQKLDRDLTLACVDLSQVQGIEDSMDVMYRQMAGKISEENFSTISKLRIKATSFGKGMEDIAGTSGYDLVDVVSLSESYAQEASSLAQAVRDAVEKAVVYHRSSVDGSSGLSIYHPYRNQSKFSSEWKNTYEQLNFCQGYTDYVNAYGRIMTGEHLTRWNSLQDFLVTEAGRQISLTISQEQADNLRSARLMVLARSLYDPADAALFSVYNTSDVTIQGTHLTAAYDGTTLQLLNESGYGDLSGAISYTMTEDGTYMVNLYPFDESLARVDKPIVAEYRLDPASGQLMLKDYAVYDELIGAYSHRADVDLSQYAGITFQNTYRNPTANSAGEYLAFNAWERDVHTDTQWKARRDITHTSFLLSFVPNSSMEESLYAAFEITDTQGNVYMTELVPIGGGVEYYDTVPSLGEDRPHLYGVDARGLWDVNTIAFLFNVVNNSEVEQSYLVSELEVNGRPVPDAYSALYKRDSLLPGETGSVIVFLDEQSLAGFEGDDAIRSVAGTLNSIHVSTKAFSKVGFTMEPMFPLDVVFHAAETPEREEIMTDVPFVFPAFGHQQFGISCYTTMQPASVAENSRIILNIAMTNPTDSDISMDLTDMEINQVTFENNFTMNTRGAGEANSAGRQSIAPGETGILNVDLRYGDIAAIMPDVVLKSVTGNLVIRKVMDGETHTQYKIPISFDMYVPLTSFYSETDVLPSQDLVDYGKENGMLDSATEKLLFSYEGCEVYLQGFYIVGREAVLFLHGVNETDVAWKARFGQAEFDGVKASIGKTDGATLSTRNDRNRTFGVQKEPWPLEMNALASIDPHSERYFYVSVSPSDAEQKEMRRLSFHVYLQEKGSPYHCVYFDTIEIVTEEAVPLSEDIEATAPAEDFMVTAGRPLPKETDAALVQEAVLLADSFEYSEIPLVYRAPEDEKIAQGYYVLLRRLRSNAELAALNIENMVSSATSQAGLSFKDGQEWLAYEAVGELTVAEDGQQATAVLPAMRMVVQANGESMPLTVTSITNDQNAVNFYQTSNMLSLSSAVFPDTVLGHAVYSIDIQYDKQSGEAKLVSYKQTQQSYASLAGSLHQEMYFLPADSAPQQVVRFINDDDGMAEHSQYMVLYLGGPNIQLALEPLDNPEDYCVVFFYLTEDSRLSCSPFLPLDGFLFSE